MATLPLQQSPAFADALTAFGAPVALRDPVIVQRRIAGFGPIGFASRGPLDTSNMRRLRRNGLHLFNAEHDRPETYKQAGYRQIITAAHIADWDISGGPDRIPAALHPKWRNQLRRAERHGVKVRHSPWRGTDHPMFQHAEALARKRRFTPLPHALIRDFAAQSPDAAHIFEAFHNTSLIAAILALRHGPTATYQTAWTSETGRTVHAHNLLLFNAACYLGTLGHTTFDLGLVETDHATSLARFKLRTGARLRKLGGTWLAIPFL